MDIPVKLVVAIVIALVVVAGVYGAITAVFDTSGDQLRDEGSDVGDQLDCVLGNKEDAFDECDPTSQEVQDDVEEIPV